MIEQFSLTFPYKKRHIEHVNNFQYRTRLNVFHINMYTFMTLYVLCIYKFMLKNPSFKEICI